MISLLTQNLLQDNAKRMSFTNGPLSPHHLRDVALPLRPSGSRKDLTSMSMIISGPAQEGSQVIAGAMQRRTLGQVVRAFGARLEAFVTRPFNHAVAATRASTSVVGGIRRDSVDPRSGSNTLRVPGATSDDEDEVEDRGPHYAVDPMTALRGPTHRASTGCILPMGESGIIGGGSGGGPRGVGGGAGGGGGSGMVSSSILGQTKIGASSSFSAAAHQYLGPQGGAGSDGGGSVSSITRSAASESIAGNGSGVVLPPILLPHNFHLKRPESRLSYR